MKLLDHLELSYNEADKDYIMSCLWCGAEDKLSVSKDEGHVFQCYRCKQTGNALTLMREWYSQLPELTMQQAKRFCSLKKGVQPFVLRSEGIKSDGTNFMFPVKNVKGDVIAIHRLDTATNIIYASPKPYSCSILGLSQLTGSEEIFIAEGHADYLILRQMSSKLPSVPDILGTCGSGFSSSYLHVLENKHVVLLFDNDEAGRQGVASVARRIKSSGHSVQSLRYLDWNKVSIPQHTIIPEKYDLRDMFNDLKG
jgi:5S rRNA maturation endonuclease (ribonuclease M5)